MNTSTKMPKELELDAADEDFNAKLVSKISNSAIENKLLYQGVTLDTFICCS